MARRRIPCLVHNVLNPPKPLVKILNSVNNCLINHQAIHQLTSNILCYQEWCASATFHVHHLSLKFRNPSGTPVFSPPPSYLCLSLWKMTTYGTIPTESPSSNLQFLSRAKEQIQSGLGTRRPWKEMIQLHVFNAPTTFPESMQRIRTNAAFFRMNYAIIILFILFCSLLWHPISLIVFIFTMVAWLFLCFLRDEPLMFFGRVIDDRILMVFLLIITIVGLFFTNAADNVLIGLSIGVVVVLVHGSLRNTDDLFFVDDAEGLGSAALFRGKHVEPMPLKDAASSSFTLS